MHNSGGKQLDVDDLGNDEEKQKREERAAKHAEITADALKESGLSLDDLEQCRLLFDDIDGDEDDSITVLATPTALLVRARSCQDEGSC